MKPLLNWFSNLELVSSNLWAVSLLETPRRCTKMRLSGVILVQTGFLNQNYPSLLRVASFHQEKSLATDEALRVRNVSNQVSMYFQLTLE
jgi:hypothetical protein